jgi:hypothetical protein
MPWNKSKGKRATASKTTTPEKVSATDALGTVEQMIQGKGFIVENGIFKDTASLAPETRATIVSNILADKKVMF